MINFSVTEIKYISANFYHQDSLQKKKEFVQVVKKSVIIFSTRNISFVVAHMIDIFCLKVIALACKDGDVTKQKIKLYCKDGTIINNVIRIVNSCVCQEHSEKVHTKKKSSKSKENFRKRTYNRRALLPKVQIVTRY